MEYGLSEKESKASDSFLLAAFLNLAMCYLKLREYTKAVECCDKVWEHNFCFTLPFLFSLSSQQFPKGTVLVALRTLNYFIKGSNLQSFELEGTFEGRLVTLPELHSDTHSSVKFSEPCPALTLGVFRIRHPPKFRNLASGSSLHKACCLNSNGSYQ